MTTDPMKCRETVAVDRLRESVEYNPETGEFRWRVRPAHHFKTAVSERVWNKKHAGRPAFVTKTCGYLMGRLDGQKVYAHRAAIALTTGEWPAADVDHINRFKDDNRLVNLRCVSHRENCLNTSRSDGPLVGVYPSATKGRWIAQVRRGGELSHLGTFSCFGRALKARRAVA